MFFFQAEDGIRDRSPSRGLGDVYKRQVPGFTRRQPTEVGSSAIGRRRLCIGLFGISISTGIGKRQRVRPKAPSRGAVGKSRTAIAAVHRLVLWAGVLSTAGGSANPLEHRTHNPEKLSITTHRFP